MDETDLLGKIFAIIELANKKQIDRIDFKEYFKTTLEFVQKVTFGSNNERRLSSDIAHTIRDASLSEKNLINSDSISNGISTLLILGDKLPSEFNQLVYEDPVICALNSTLGQVYLALLAITSRWRKMFFKLQETAWPPEIKAFFEAIMLGKKERTPEFDTIIGFELNNLEFYDTTWVHDWIGLIFLVDNADVMKRALIGYFDNPNPLSMELYFMLRQKGLYQRAIREHLPDRCIRSLAYAIFVGYFEGYDEIGDPGSLIKDLIDFGRDDHIDHLIHIFWQFRKEIVPNLRQKVIPLWRKILFVVQNRKDLLDQNRLLARLSWWIDIVDQINEEVIELLKPSLEVIGTLDAIRLLDIFKERPSLGKWERILPQIIKRVEYPEYERNHLEPAIDFLSKIRDSQKPPSDQIKIRMRGTVKFFNEKKGYGFIIPQNGGPDVFIHFSEIVAPENKFRTLIAGQEVEFSLGPGRCGGIQAINVEILQIPVDENKTHQDLEHQK